MTGQRSSFLTTFLACIATYAFTAMSLHGKLEKAVPKGHHEIVDESFRLPPNKKTGKEDEPSPSPGGNFSASACLLLMDDNHFLIEWLAYHYHVLPLRHLIVAVDPRSKTSPDHILQRWRNQGMEIQQWKDRDYMSVTEQKLGEQIIELYFQRVNPSAELVRHRARQRLFYYKCMKKLKEDGRDWTLMIDSDEFLFVNYKTVAALNLTAPPISESGSVMSFLRNELQRPGHNLTTPCVQIPRIRFGAKESPPEMVNKGVPEGFNASTFQTLRWRKHAHEHNYKVNKISKTMIDLSRVDWNEIMPVDSIHRPIKSMCSQRRLHIRAPDQVFRISHYLGTWEQYTYRDDPRGLNERSRYAYEKSMNLDQGIDDDIRPWLEGFVQSKGLSMAKNLLKDVGALKSRSAVANTTNAGNG